MNFEAGARDDLHIAHGHHIAAGEGVNQARRGQPDGVEQRDDAREVLINGGPGPHRRMQARAEDGTGSARRRGCGAEAT